MLMAKATDYFAVPSIWIKMSILVLAAITMLLLERQTFRSVAGWDKDSPLLAGARIVGFVSLSLWILVIVFGRWIGYTVDHGVVFGHGF